ncbi:unnamed protein product [Leptidea sinapis]|uniref:VWFC domain-containing protein n=1 Tax=Leptidea sinapis TaxID=189913 RepID=A0A5E4QML9_9NEOP|nr:unnamed protein product [Leptidea sinapis]
MRPERALVSSAGVRPSARPPVPLPHHDIKLLEDKGKPEDTDIATPESIGNSCVEVWTVYAAGSAMSSKVACEQCFCLGGTRRCVRPKCLPPPPGCHARPSHGACCPQRYYCDHASNVAVKERNPHDCKTAKGNWISEGQRATDAEDDGCVQCFCLRGTIRCQHASCAPTVQGCAPLLQPGQCCPHQYQCIPKSVQTASTIYKNREG